MSAPTIPCIWWEFQRLKKLHVVIKLNKSVYNLFQIKINYSTFLSLLAAVVVVVAFYKTLNWYYFVFLKCCIKEITLKGWQSLGAVGYHLWSIDFIVWCARMQRKWFEVAHLLSNISSRQCSTCHCSWLHSMYENAKRKWNIRLCACSVYWCVWKVFAFVRGSSIEYRISLALHSYCDRLFAARCPVSMASIKLAGNLSLVHTVIVKSTFLSHYFYLSNCHCVTLYGLFSASTRTFVQQKPFFSNTNILINSFALASSHWNGFGVWNSEHRIIFMESIKAFDEYPLQILYRGIAFAYERTDCSWSAKRFRAKTPLNSNVFK